MELSVFEPASVYVLVFSQLECTEEVHAACCLSCRRNGSKKKSGTPQNEQRDDVNLGRDAEIVDPSQ